MGRFLVVGAVVMGALLALTTLAGPVAAANTNLTATARRRRAPPAP